MTTSRTAKIRGGGKALEMPSNFFVKLDHDRHKKPFLRACPPKL
jgi:hypothetical protein